MSGGWESPIGAPLQTVLMEYWIAPFLLWETSVFDEDSVQNL